MTAVIGVALPVVALAACGGPTATASRDVPTTLGPTTTSTVTIPTTAAAAAPPCDSATIATAVARYNRYASVTGSGCSGNFAFASIVLSGPPPYTGAKATLLLAASDGTWQVVNRTTYCADGSVPADISQSACASG